MCPLLVGTFMQLCQTIFWATKFLCKTHQAPQLNVKWTTVTEAYFDDCLNAYYCSGGLQIAPSCLARKTAVSTKLLYTSMVGW